VWRPVFGEKLFEKLKYSTLVKIADARKLSKKIYNNIISPVRCVLEHGYRDHPEKHNPAAGLKGFRITKRDRPVVDPFTIEEAGFLIAAIRRDWGKVQANHDEFHFFTGLRSSEQIVSGCDVAQGNISVTKARVIARDKDRTKTSEDPLVELCPPKRYGRGVQSMVETYAAWLDSKDAVRLERPRARDEEGHRSARTSSRR
jgi:integrase